MKKIGLIINPFAGIGGSVGLKGSDGEEIRDKALQMGAKPKANLRTEIALKNLVNTKDIFFYTCPGLMGENLLKKLKFPYQVINMKTEEMTNADDTIYAAKEMYNLGVDIILFAGGDGTARNIYDAIGTNLPVLGIPAGVKIHSAVYAHNPNKAGELLSLYITDKTIQIKEQEVMDIDEEKYRQGRVNAKLYGFLKVPFERQFIQNRKSGGTVREETALEGIANGIVDDMKDDTYYLIGSGTTTRSVMDVLNLPNTLLGVDIVYNKELIAADVSANQILDTIKDKETYLVITLIGGQGHIFGRGNQQFSPEVLNLIPNSHILVIATQNKLNTIFGFPMLIDTGDNNLDERLSAYYKVRCGYDEYIAYKASS